MKRKFYLSLLCVMLLVAGTSIAQTNTTYDKAIKITFGDTIVSQFTPGSVESLWYKFDVVGGQWYEIPHPPFALDIFQSENDAEQGYTWYGYTYNDSYEGYRAIMFKAAANGTYYISRWYNEFVGDRLEWSLIQVTDNRVCDNAYEVALDSVVNVPTGQDFRWYKTEFEAGKYYMTESFGANSPIYESCEGTYVASAGDVYHAETSGFRYFRLNFIEEDATFKVKEIPEQTNTTHETAKTIELGQPIEYSHIFGENLYFKFDVEAGNTYEIIGIPNCFYHSHVAVYDTNENSPVETTRAPAGFLESYRLTATKTGTLHIKRFEYWDHTVEMFTMTVNQITDARICSNAVEVNVGQQVSYDHTTYHELWWKVNLDANSTYLIDFHNEYGDYDSLYVYSDCGEETAIKKSSGGILNFSTPMEGYYYLHSLMTYSYPDETKSNSFTINKLVNDDNTSCASAKEIVVNGTVTTSFSFGDQLWYKVDVQAGKVYELDGSNAGYPNLWEVNISIAIFTSCDEPLPIEEARRNPVLYLAPEVNTSYYITWQNRGDVLPNPFTWSFNEVTDNRACQTAYAVTLDQEITIAATGIYWYTLEVEAGKFYEIDFSEAYSSDWDSDMMTIYSDCNPQSILSSLTKSKHLLAPISSGVLYFKILRLPSSNGLVWKVSEVSTADNRLCAYAQEITLDTDVQTDHTPGYINLWYKISLEAGKAYEVDALEAGTNLYYYIGEVCYTPLENSYLNYIGARTKSLITSEVDTVFYFRSADKDLYHNFTWKIIETQGDNRLCTFATPITLGTAFNIDHRDSESYWYKLDVTKNTMYSVDFQQTNYQRVGVYDGCEGNRIKMGYAKSFTFSAQNDGTYYLNFTNTYLKPTFDCTVNKVVDNRSCLYPTNVSAGQQIKEAHVEGGLWYSIQLNTDTIYEFDFTYLNNRLTGSIYSSCDEKLPLAQGDSEKMLYKPATSGAYLVHVSALQDSLNWSVTVQESGDRRLCEYATEVSVGDTITTDFADSWRNQWYKVEVQTGKYYEIGNADKELNILGIEVYTACGEQTALTSIMGAGTLSAETDTVWYLKVMFPFHYTSITSAQWYIMEVSPEGRMCNFGLEAKIGELMTTYNYHATAEFDVGWEDFSYFASEGTWYNLSVAEAGIYEIRLQDWENYEDGFYGPFYYAHVFASCDLNSSYKGSAGHTFNVGRISFEAEENSVFYILTEQYLPSPEPFTWEIVKIGGSTAETGILGVSLANEEGDFINVSTANVRVYRKDNDTLLPAGTATWTDWKGISMYETNEISVGAYLIYVDGVPGYLAEWYNHAGVWEDATEVILTERGVRVEIRPKAIPEDISSGSVSISGSVFDAAAAQPGGSAAIEGVSISIYREKSSSQQSQAQRSKVFYRIVNPVVWELVATIKTDANGQYQINQLPQGRYKIIVDLPGFSTEDGGVVIDAVEGESYSNNNFEADTVTMTVSRQVTGLRGPALQNISLYPNPFDKELVIVHAEDCWLQVFNLEGVQVFTQQLTQTRETVRFDKLPSGIYFFRLEKDGGTASFTAIKR